MRTTGLSRTASAGALAGAYLILAGAGLASGAVSAWLLAAVVSLWAG